jgi:hypothetical protein
MLIKEGDRKKFADLVEKEQDGSAFALFYDKYIQPLADGLTSFIQGQMKKVLDNPDSSEVSAIVLSIKNASTAYEKASYSLFSEFTKEVYTPVLFERLGVKDPQLKKTILNKTLTEFSEKTKGALANTNSMVLSSIRKIQTDIIKANLQIAAKENIPGILKKEIAEFKRKLEADIKKNNPQFYRMLEEGKLIKSRTLPDGSYYTYGLENYADMSVQTTLMNVERDSVEIAALAEGAPVVGYKLINDRKLKGKERPICKHILATKVRGIAVLALDPDVAGVLGVMTVSEAKGKGAMGVNCRHGLVPLDSAYLTEVNKALFVAGLVPNVNIEEVA